MAGSGLTEVMECCYGRNTVIHMLAGKAVKRAIRGHFLVDSALRILMLRQVFNQCLPEADDIDSSPELVLPDEEFNELRELYENAIHHRCALDDVESSSGLQRLQQLISEQESYLAEKSRTARLWLQYCHYVDVLK